MKNVVSSLDSLGPGARRLLIASALNNLGTGLVLPLLVAYVTLVLDLDVRVATTAVAVTSVGVAVGGPLAGWGADRFGRQRAITAALSVSMLGTLGYSVASNIPTILAAAALLGLGLGGNAVWFTLLAESVPSALRPRVFGLNLLAVNASIGLGGLISGLIVRELSESSFRLLYVANAVTFVAALALIRSAIPLVRAARAAPLPVAVHAGGVEELAPAPSRDDSAAADTSAVDEGSARPERSEGSTGSTYWDLLRDRRLAPVLALVALSFTVGYSQLEGGIPAALIGGRHVSPTQLAIAFGVNTVAVIVSQMVLQSRLEKASARTNAIAIGLIWGLTWVCTAAALRADAGTPALLWLALGLVVFAVGECVFGVTVPVLVNSLVDDDSRGRANGLYSVMMSIGFFVGPLLAGQLLVEGSAVLMVVTFGGACFAVAVLAALVVPRDRLDRVGETR